MTSENTTLRQQFRDAVWDSELTTKAKLVALAYERYSGNGLDHVWVHGPTLRRITNLSRDTANRALRELEGGGWLVVVEPAKQHRSTVYRLVIPSQRSDGRKAAKEQCSDSATVSVPIPGAQRSEVPYPNREVNRDENSAAIAADAARGAARAWPAGVAAAIDLAGEEWGAEQAADEMLARGEPPGKVAATIADRTRTLQDRWGIE